MEILRSLDAMREWRASLAPNQHVGFAPTMGNLHAGHIELINVIKQQSDVVVASILLNYALDSLTATFQMIKPNRILLTKSARL